jgi:UDP-2,3-diacylglucosamine pyrophosphatase LpxH
MTNQGELNIAIVSDLHLSEGRDPRTKRFDRNEDFFFDANFDRFLSHLESEAERRNRNWRLIIAGDMVDFLQVTKVPDSSESKLRKSEYDYGLGTSPEKTIWKMKIMMDGHWLFFRALGRFISRGNNCTIIAGNHDIEWTVPEVHKAFRGEMKNYLPKGTRNANKVVSSQIEFCPWFYYEPGLVWVEHGHQYDGMNSFDYLLFPYLPHSNEVMLPSGSFFVRYLFNKIEQKDPFADNIKPTSKYIRRYWAKLLCSRNISNHLKDFLKIIWKVREFTREELKELRKKNEEGIRSEAKHFGISAEKLDAVRSPWVPCFLYNKGKWSNIVSFLRYDTGDTHRRIASSIGRQLGVRYVVFGHTHEADLHSLSSDAGAEYANSGSWTKVFSSDPAERLLHEEHELVFVQILKDENNKLELMKWKDELGRGERVNLFERGK